MSTKQTPGQEPTTRSNRTSVSGKAPVSESAQKSITSKEDQTDEIIRARNARKSVSRLEKITPSEEYGYSASKHQVSSSGGKEQHDTSRKSLPGQAGKDKVHETPMRSVNPSNETITSSAKNKQEVQNKVQKTGPSTPVTQQTHFDPKQGFKLITRSAEKESNEKLLASGEKPLQRRQKGKESIHSENLYNRDGIGKSKVTEEQDLDLETNLEEMLNDKDAKVSVTAKKSKGPLTGEKQKKEDDVIEEKEGEEDKSVLQNQAQTEEVKANIENVEIEEGKIERKEYSVYEDWRIFETIDGLVEEQGVKALSSRSLWAKMEDPSTGRRLLDDKRSSESMRDRYKRYLIWLDEAAKETIKEFCESHSTLEARKNHCLFKKVEGQKQFVGISSQLNYDPERISRKTPYGTKSKKRSPDAKKSQRRSAEDTKKGKVQEDWEQEDDVEEENKFDDILLRQSELNEDIEEVTQTQTKITKVTGSGKNISKEIVVTRDTEIITAGGKSKPQVVSMTSTTLPNNNKPDRVTGFRETEDQTRGSKKRKATDNQGLADTGKREIKKVKQNDDYEETSLIVNNVFQNRRPARKAGPVYENLMIYVDLEQGFRQFILHDSGFEEEEKEEDTVSKRLRQLAEKYRKKLNWLLEVFSQVSCDFDDLEEYLEKKDDRILWTEEEDADLLNDVKIAIKYLKQIKGEERVQKRREYLLEVFD